MWRIFDSRKFSKIPRKFEDELNQGLAVFSGSETLINWFKICCRPFLYENFFLSASQQNSTGEVQMLSLANQIVCSVAESLLISSMLTASLQWTLPKIASVFLDRSYLKQNKVKGNWCKHLLGLKELKDRARNTTLSTDRALASVLTSWQITKRRKIKKSKIFKEIKCM